MTRDGQAIMTGLRFSILTVISFTAGAHGISVGYVLAPVFSMVAGFAIGFDWQWFDRNKK